MSPPAALTEAERARALSAPPPRVPPKVIAGIVGACLLLGFGGIGVDHFFGGASKTGLTSTPTTTTTNVGPPATTPDPALSSSVASMMDLRATTPRPAPEYTLVSAATGHAVTPTSWRGRVVVLWFFDSRCDDICPVAEREILAASSDLAPAIRARVEFVAVNADPLATAPADGRSVLRRMKSLGARFVFLTGPLRRLNAVWKAYGLAVEAQPQSGLVSHSELCDFVDPSGRVVAAATPAGDQLSSGRYVLSGTAIDQFGRGVASEATLLARGASKP